MDYAQLKRFKIGPFVIFTIGIFILSFFCLLFFPDLPGGQEWLTLIVSIAISIYIVMYSRKFGFQYSENTLKQVMTPKSWIGYLTLTASIQIFAVIISFIIIILLYIKFADFISLFEFAILAEGQAQKTPIIAYILFFISTSILAPLWEEMFFRGILMRRYLTKWSPQKSIIISSLFFGVIHINPLTMVFAFFLGCVLGYAYFKTKSILLPMILHGFSNFIALLQMIFTNGQSLEGLPTIENAKSMIFMSLIALMIFALIIVIFFIKNFKTFRSLRYETNEAELPEV